MTIAESAVGVSAEPSESVAQQPPEIRTFVAAISTVLRETVAAFERTVGRITEITVTRPGRADRDLVVALQDFDRLQQEFATLGEVLARLSAGSGASAAEGPAQDVMAAISMADLKERLAHHLKILTSDMPEPDTEEVVF